MTEVLVRLKKVMRRIRRSEERKGWPFVVGVIWVTRVQLWGRRQSSVAS